MAVDGPLPSAFQLDRLNGRYLSSEALYKAIGHRFADSVLLAEALCHPSAAEATRRRHGYERLEFLGDRVLGLVMADMLLHAFPDEDEGHLSRRFVALVRRETLVRVADRIGLADFLTLSPGEEESGGRDNPAVLADSCEALIGALYLDGGLDVARRLIERYWTDLIDEDVSPPKDAKTALQEWLQGRGRPLPVYEVIDQQGPAHDPRFTVEVRIKGYPPGRGEGSSKRAAEQRAAEALMETIGKAASG